VATTGRATKENNLTIQRMDPWASSSTTLSRSPRSRLQISAPLHNRRARPDDPR
jgi:hypothetical protein